MLTLKTMTLKTLMKAMQFLPLFLLLAASAAFAQVPVTVGSNGPSILTQLAAPLMDLLMAAASVGFIALAAYLRSKSAESKAAKVGLLVSEAANAAVHELDATLRPQLEAALADGVLTDEEKAKLKAAAIELLKTKLPAGLLGLAGTVFGAFTDTYLSGKIEQAVAAKNALQAAGDARSPQ